MTRRSPDDPIGAADPLDRNRYPIDGWKFTEAEYSADDLGVTESLFAVGNGYLGMRGNVEEGRETYTHGTFINGFHETWPIRHAEEAFGFARTGQTIVNVPDNKTIKLYVDDEPMLLSVADLESYERALDFRDGLLRRDIIWRTPGGKRVKVSSTRMVSFTPAASGDHDHGGHDAGCRGPSGDLLADSEPPGWPLTSTTSDLPPWALEPIPQGSSPSSRGCSSRRATGGKISGSSSAIAAPTPR